MNTIQLDNKWSITPDTYSWCLTQQVEKTRKNKETKEEEQYTTEEKWYFPTLQKCLEEYTNEATKECQNMEEVLQKLIDIKDTVEKVRKIYVQEGKLIQTD